ncbi:MAG TPA: hypothetical protein VK850_04745 [Candidatus Binatia bacterium]|nr:hypothetical protein [Candidatus Binatia bacterium]
MAKYKYIMVLAFASVSSVLGNFADRVISYDPGVGYAKSFSGVGYTNSNAALGQPNRDTSFGPVQPFNPPFDLSEIVSMGTNGSITLRMATPVINGNGADFVLYGNTGFIDVDYPNGRTDSAASTFGENPGTTRVWVSADDNVYYLLNPAMAPVVDQLFPTDGAGHFGVPLNPALTRSNFYNVSLQQIRQLYAGSAGGTAYDVAWAEDNAGNPVFLPAIRYVRIEVLTGRAELDGIAGVSGRAMFAENFSGPPSHWQVHGKSSLFATNAGALNVTWDSREPNSYFYHKLGTVLARDDDFRFEFDLTLRDLEIGVTPNRPYTFEVALGLINLRSATAPDFFRGQFSGTRNIVEFDYFPAFSSFGATVASTIVSSNNMFAYTHNFPLEMPTGDLFHVSMNYTAGNSTLLTTMTRNGEPFGPLETTSLGATFSDFRVDAFAISSYTDDRADGSILAHGAVDNVVIIYPEGPSTQLTGRFVSGTFEARFMSRSNWYYQLEHSSDLTAWNLVGALTPGTGGELTLTHQNPSAHSFYRVRAERP